MPIPAFSIDGVIPPFVGPAGPGGARADMTPYEATPLEVVERLGGSPRRREILGGWLAHRAALRTFSFPSGFQWLDGSFVEDKEPDDLDVVSFLRRPPAALGAQELRAMMVGSPATFSRAVVKDAHCLDAMFVDLNSTPEGMIDSTRYWLGLFSHRRVDSLWKGMLKVELGDDDVDGPALASLAADAVVP